MTTENETTEPMKLPVHKYLDDLQKLVDKLEEHRDGIRLISHDLDDMIETTRDDCGWGTPTASDPAVVELIAATKVLAKMLPRGCTIEERSKAIHRAQTAIARIENGS